MILRCCAVLAVLTACSSSTPNDTDTTPQLPAGWSSVASSSYPRNQHTATLLNDGRVLVAGGGGPGTKGCTTSADLYDPAANTWSATGAMNVNRQNHGAIKLTDGRVLVFGGYDCTIGGDKYLKSAETYDSTSGKWTSLPDAPDEMPPRPRATLFPDGRVVITGSSTLMIFDPKTNTIVHGYDGGKLRYAGSNVTHLDGARVLVTGGGAAVEPIAEAFIWNVDDPASGVGGIGTSDRHAYHEAARLDDGRVMVVGGLNAAKTASQPFAEIFDPKTNKWTTHAESLEPHGDMMTLTRVSDGRLLLIGARNQTSRAAIYAQGTNSWKKIELPSTLLGLGHTATLLNNGKVFYLKNETAFLYQP
jgi:hypothetical protein